MVNFNRIDPEEIFSKLTNDFQEFKEYLFERGKNNDLKLCTIVLDDLTQFLVKNYKEQNQLLDKTLQYIEDVITLAYQKDVIKVTIFEGLYSEYRDTLSELKKLFKKETKQLLEDWLKNECRTLFNE